LVAALRGRAVSGTLGGLVHVSALRIYADFNGLVAGPKNPTRTAVVLDTFGSLRDLSNAGVVLSEGLPLIAVDASDDHEDLEAHGTAQYDKNHRWWVVEFDELGVRHVPGGSRNSDAKFQCVKCETPFPFNDPQNAFQPGVKCQHCGTSVLAAYDPPAA
jgi:DNA-directed RNA polymerase subunit RPC12/RpoP